MVEAVKERRVKLTEAACEAFPVPTDKKKLRFSDTVQKGLKFSVNQEGRRWFSLRYTTLDGRPSEASLGDYPGLLPKEARVKAEALLSEIRSHTIKLDPAEARRKARAEREAREAEVARARLNTFGSVSEAYLRASRSGRFSGRATRKAETTIAKEEHSLKLYVLPVLGERPIKEITRAEVKALYAKVAERAKGPKTNGLAAANTALECVRRVFAYALDHEPPLVDASPALGIKMLKNAPRRVTANDAQLRLLWRALEADKADRVYALKRTIEKHGAATGKGPAFFTASALQVALLTLQRRGEVVRMRRQDVDLERSLWRCPAEFRKERRDSEVPLSPEAVAVVREAMKGSKSKAGWIFVGAGGEDHLGPKVLTRYMERLRKLDAAERAKVEARIATGKPEAGDEERLQQPPLSEITPHDLRRTARTKLTSEELGIAPETAERVLGHAVGSAIFRTYDTNSYNAEKRRALDAWASELLRIVSETPPAADAPPENASNVFPLRRAK